jgi:hypothetical protein
MKKFLIGLGIAIALLGGAVVVLPPLLFGDGVDYSHAISIKTTAEYQDAALLQKAWALPVAATYQKNIDYQKNPSFCGPTSVINVMRSLGMSAEQSTVLQDTGEKTTLGMLWGGITLDRLAEVARKKTNKTVTVLRDLDAAAFRDHLKHVNDPDRRYIANFNRGPLFAKAGGHHSPLAAYLETEDLVLVLDVNDSYKPWLVKSDRLLAAINTRDKATAKSRGLLLIR